ncbi:MAG TPA: hypothetical protein PL155_04095 [Candidatus Omnitrophota bacterium]|nr:hypothetical protein [Candidatus Omnitrophota bacterium]HPD84343.1 hypothetical protein [Candidatus Omnitrophota bacterium]HRZ03201.1 hypothetical protein [Candidatus Omnitrophota bacterium]
MAKKFLKGLVFLAVAISFIFIYWTIRNYIQENAMLKEVIKRLEATSRVAQVLVTNVNFDEQSQKTSTTIKFLEFDSQNKPLEPKYFTFAGNIIQFQSLVVRFDDIKIRQADKLRGKSAYLFMNVFLLDGENTQVFEINRVSEIPLGYRVDKKGSPFEKKIWENFWRYALDPGHAQSMGIKNAQIEAPGTVFVPGTLYTIKIEHDGGLRIDAEPLPEILKGEQIAK